MVGRSATLDLLDDIREAFPTELKDAGTVLRQRDDLLADAHERAQAMLADAKAEHDRLIGAGTRRPSGWSRRPPPSTISCGHRPGPSTSTSSPRPGRI